MPGDARVTVRAQQAEGHHGRKRFIAQRSEMIRICLAWALIVFFLGPAPLFARTRVFFTRVIEKADDTVCRFSFPVLAITVENGRADIRISGMENAGEPGEPLLPVYYARILVPPGKKVGSVVVREGVVETISGRFVVKHARHPIPLSYRGPVKVTPPDVDIYGSDDLYPAYAGRKVSIQRKHGRSIVIIRLNPVRYRPASGRLFRAREFEITVGWKMDKRRLRSQARRKTRSRSSDVLSVNRLVDNPSMNELHGLVPKSASEMERGEMDALIGAGPGTLESTLLSEGDFEHVIISTETLLNTPGPHNFQALNDARNASGMTSTNVSLEWICTNYPGTRPFGDPDDPTRIRNFIADAYVNWGTRFVLLGGTSDEVPVRMFWVEAGGDTTTMPVDMYYGCLDGTFDGNTNGIYGEPDDGLDGGEVDLTAEVYVGRVCVANTSEVANVVRKTFEYEESATSHLAKVTMLGEHLGFGGVSEYAKPAMEQIREGGTYDGYSTIGFENSVYSNDFDTGYNLYEQDGNWSKQTLIDRINSGVHVLNHLGHATWNKSLKLYVSDLSSLTNTDYFFAYSQACNSGQFDVSDCFAESVTTMDDGAVAVVMNTRSGWGAGNSTDGYSQRFNRRFWDIVLGSDIFELGQANQEAKEDTIGQINEGCTRWCYYEITLFGDPALPFARRVIGGPPEISHTPLENVSSTSTSYRVDANVTPGSLLDTNMLSVTWNTNGSTTSFSTNTLVHVAKHLYRGYIPQKPLETTIYYSLQAYILNGRSSCDPTNAPDVLHSFQVVPDIQFDVSGSPGNHGEVDPGYGSHFFPSGVVVNASADLTTTPENGRRYRCDGWSGGGSAPSDGASNTTSFVIEESSSVEWQWTTQYLLEQTSSVNGIINTSTWWAALCTGETVTAASSVSVGGTNYCFAGWLLDGIRMPDTTNTAVNPVTDILMPTSHVAEAVYFPENLDEDDDAMSDWWEHFYFGSTNASPSTDDDGDGFPNTNEFLDRTDPRNTNSVPTAPAVDHTPLVDPQSNPAPYEITASVTDNYSVAAVTLCWQRVIGPYYATNMTAGETPDQYTAFIPVPGTNGDRFEYCIMAWDSAGNESSNGVWSFDVVYPVMDLSPMSVVEILYPNTSTNCELVITNSGITNLIWGLAMEPVGMSGDVESGTNGWSHSGTNDLWHISTNRAFSETHSWYCGDEALGDHGEYVDDMDASLVLPAVKVMSDAELTFRHWAFMEYDREQQDNHYWDGGIVELSTNDGTTFWQIAPEGGYPHLITSNTASPFAPETPCYGGTGAWQQAVFDLSSYHGQDITIRFRFGSDGYVVEEGWYIDDVVIGPVTGTNEWLGVGPTSGVLSQSSATSVVVTLDSAGMPTGDRGAFLRMTCNDPYSRTSNIPVSMGVRSPPVLELTYAAQTSTNGAGYVTLSNRVYDVDGETCELELLYSQDGGNSWTNAWILDVQTTLGNAVISNDEPRAVIGIASTNGAGAATNELEMTWDTTNSPALIELCTDTLVRARVWDGSFSSGTVTSSPFMVDNQPPSVTASLSVTSHVENTWSTNNRIGMLWSSATDGDGAGVAGYAYIFTNNSVAHAPAMVMTQNLYASSLVSPDDTNWWVGVRSIDEKGNASTTTNAGPYWIDTIPPSETAAVITIAHSMCGNYVVSAAVTSSWTGFSDTLSGISNYYFSFTNRSGTANGTWTTNTSGALTDPVPDQTNSVYVWARDNAGLIGSAAGAPVLVLDSGGGDFDQDGLLNSEEEICGTDATDTNSLFVFQSIAAHSSTGTIVFEWQSVTGRVYSLYETYSLTNESGGWTPVSDCTNVPGTGGTMSYTDTVTGVTSWFYIVTVNFP